MKVLMKRLFLTIIITLSTVNIANAQMLAIKTNAAAYAAFAPNLGAELVVGNKASIGIDVMGAYHSFGTNLKAFGVIPEFRYWFHGRPMTREFIGLSILGATYKCSTDEKMFKGNVASVGLTIGYVWVLGKKSRWNMELHGGIGLYRYSQQTRYDSHWTQAQWDNDRFSETGWVVLPYKVGLSFSYVIPTEKKEK